MSNNKAREKYNSERDNNLARDEPLRKIGNTVQRKSPVVAVYERLSDLSDLHIDAAIEIERGYRLSLSREHFKTTSQLWAKEFHRQGDVEQAEIYAQTVKDKYDRWFDELGQRGEHLERSMSLDILACGKTFKECAFTYSRDWRTIRQKTIECACVYVDLHEFERYKQRDRRPSGFSTPLKY